MKNIKPFLMFTGEQHGRAEEAMRFYTSLFEHSAITAIERYAEGEDQPAGTVKVAAFSLNGREFMAMDSAISHGFTFTPALSLYVDCESAQEIERVYAALAEGGMPLMPLDNYGFSQRFGWLQDKFGISWQLNLP